MARVQTALRIPAGDLEAIDARAVARGLTRTEYMIRASLGTLTDTGDVTTEERLDVIERRLTRLEQLAFGD